MKIHNNILNNLSFKKRLSATCSIVKNGKPTTCKIFELQTFEDRDYFKKVNKDKDWKKNYFVDSMHYCLKQKTEEEQIFTIEDDREKCLGYALITQDYNSSKKINLHFLETCPIYTREYNRSKKNNPTEIKYIGETLLAYITSLLKTQNIEELRIPKHTKSATHFYIDNCGFELESQFPKGLTLNNTKFDNLIKRNILHTGQQIKFEQ